MIKIKNNSGFTLIEVVAVIGVLAVTSAILIANNRLNELQISLNTNIAGITSVINRAKSLTLQGAGADKNICGYGVNFAQGLNNDPDTYTIYSYTDCVNWTKGEALSGQGGINTLSAGLRILKLTALNNESQSQFIKDVIFYSSDAKVKLFNFNNRSICLETGCDVKSQAGIIIINTESFPTSFATLKIATTGQVTSKVGVYSNVENFDNDAQSETTTENGEVVVTENTQETTGGQTDGGQTNGETGEPIFNGFSDEDCIPDCACAASLASGRTCPNGCGGVCYAGGGSDGDKTCTPTAGICDGKTCADKDNCGVPCLVCDAGFACLGQPSQCVPCAPVCDGKKCGDDNACGGVCTFCDPGENCQKQQNNSWQCIVAPGPSLRVDSIFPSIGTK